MAKRVKEATPFKSTVEKKKIKMGVAQSVDENVSDSGENQEQIQQALSLALKDGVANPSSIMIYVLGQENAGKTCLIASLLGDKFEERMATQGADVDVSKIFASKWSRIERSKVPTKLQKLYHGQLHVTAKIKISPDKQQPVLEARNRQQLLESLGELPEAVKADLEQAKTAILVDDDGINAIIWDFAGQSVYYGLHSMFIKQDNVAMIVFDASQPLNDPVKGRDSQKDPYAQKSISPTYTGVESVCYWLQSIHTIRKDGINQGAASIFVPTIFLVATHIDLIGDSKAIQKRKKEIINQLVLLLKGKPFGKHIPGLENGLREALEKCCFFISNKVRNVDELDRLRFMLGEAFHYIKNREHPVVFLNIEKTLLSLNKAAISATEFYAIAFESGFLAKPESEESKGALAYFHNKGTVLHFPQKESLKDVVVLSPDWLRKLFSYIIIAHPYILECNYSLQYKRLKNYGILGEDFIAFMVKKFNAEQEKYGLLISTKQAIEFAQLFGFVAEVHKNMHFLEEMHQPPVSQNKIFIVPPMLPIQLPSNVKVPDDKAPEARIVYFKFPEGFIPPMVYYQMLSACIDRNIRRQENLYWIRREMIKMVLGYDQLYYVSLCADHQSIRLAIVPDDDGVVTTKGLQERWKLIEEFNYKLMKTVKAFMPASKPPQCYIPCSLCTNLHLKLDDIRADDKPLYCFKGKLPKDYYCDLRQYQTLLIDDGNIVNATFKEISHRMEPTLQKLGSFLEKLLEWEAFGIQLLPEDKTYLVAEIKRDNEIKGTTSCKIALYIIFIQVGVKTWEQVLIALNKSGHKEIAKKVEKQLLELYRKEIPSVPKQNSAEIKDDHGNDLWTQQDLIDLISSTTREAISLPKDIEVKVLQSVVVWLVTINTDEILATQVYLKHLEIDGYKSVFKFSSRINQTGQQANEIIYYIGKYGDCPAAISDVSSSFGVLDSEHSLSSITHELFPNLAAVISVGVAHGIEKKVKIGDILVSSSVVCYDKVMDGHQTITVSQQLIDIFHQYIDWNSDIIQQFANINDKPAVKTGLILSYLFDNPAAKAKKIHSEVIGIENGKANLFGNVQHTGTNVIIVKAVSDFGEYSPYQPSAALLAAYIVFDCLSGDLASGVFTAKKVSHEMIQEAKDRNLTIKVRHAKVMFCGAAHAGKTSFSRLLQGKPHIFEYESTPVGKTTQVVSDKISLESSKWVTLDIELETERLTKIMYCILQKSDTGEDDKKNSNSTKTSTPDAASNKPSTEKQSTEKSKVETNDTKSDDQHLIEDVQKYQDNGLMCSNQSSKSPLVKDGPFTLNVQLSVEAEMASLSISELKDKMKDTWDLFTLLDTGGQPEFIKMLPAINAFAAITFVVLNLCEEGKESINDKVIAQYSCKNHNYPKHKMRYTDKELIECLLSSVRTAATMQEKSYFDESFMTKIIAEEDQHVKPVVCFIGTHADELKKESNDVLDHINEEISGLEIVKKNEKDEVFIIWCDVSTGNYLTAIDNTAEENKANSAIQEKTFDSVDHIHNKSNKLLESKTQYVIPISWFILELEIRKCCEANGRVYINLHEIKDICDQIMPSHRTMNHFVIKEVMKFYHMFGTLLYFHEVEDGMNEIVITDPQWLFNNLTRIITCKFDKSCGFDNSSDINAMKHRGICSKNLLEKLTLDRRQGVPIKSFLKLLVYLKVIAPMKNDRYFIPSVLPTRDDEFFSDVKSGEHFGKAIVFTSDGSRAEEIEPLLISSKFGTIPRGLFGFLIVQLLQDNPDLHSENDPTTKTYYCFGDVVTFRIELWWYFTLTDMISYLMLQVRVRGKKKLSYHLQVQKIVTKALKIVCGQFNWQPNDCRYGFFCKECPNKDHPSLLSNEVLITSKINDYTECKHKEIMELEREQKIWFQNVEGYLQPSDDETNACPTTALSSSHPDNVDCSTAQENIKKYYCDLTNLQIDLILGKLFSKSVITSDQKQEIQDYNPTEKKKMEHFLDKIIIPSLKCGDVTKFKGFLETLKESGDSTLISMAKNLASSKK